MIHFAFAIFSVVFSVLSGVLCVGVILAGHFSFPAMIGAMVVGAALAVPASYAVLKRMDWSKPDPRHQADKDRWRIR